MIARKTRKLIHYQQSKVVSVRRNLTGKARGNLIANSGSRIECWRLNESYTRHKADLPRKQICQITSFFRIFFAFACHTVPNLIISIIVML